MASSKAKYMRRRRNAVLAAVALALVLIIVIIVIIVGISKRGSGSGSGNLPTATPPQTALPTPNTNIGNYDPTATTPGSVTPSPSPTAAAGTVMYVTGSTVNVREEASSSSRVLTTLSKGDKVTAGKLDGEFYAVTLSNGIEGYVSKNYLAKQEASNDPTPTPGATPDTSNGKTMYVTKDSVNVRSKASTNGDKLTQLNKNDKVTAFGVTNGWYYIEYATGKYGYISKDYLTETKPTTSATASTSPTPSPTPAPTAISDWTELGLPNYNWSSATSSATRNQYKANTVSGVAAQLVDPSYAGGHVAYKIKKLDGSFYYIAYDSNNQAAFYTELTNIPGTPVQ